MRIAAIINAERSTKEIHSQLQDSSLKKDYGFSLDAFIVPGNEIESTIKNLNFSAYNAVLIGGGDGTVRTAAQAILEENIPLIILPLGTFNLFAKSLKYPDDIISIFNIIQNFKTKQVDLAEVNGKVIINHAWIGFYYNILKLRKKYSDQLKKNKLLKIIFNSLSLFKPLPIYSLELNFQKKIINIKTCLVFISNNEFYSNLLDFGERKVMTSGLLSITILHCTNRWQLFKCILNILTNRFDESKYISHFSTDHIKIDSRRKNIDMVLDGELLNLKFPLYFTNHHKKLTVITP